MATFSYSVSWGAPTDPATQDYTPFATNEEARKARDHDYHILVKEHGLKVRRSTLTNQLRKYWSFGNPCGITCNVYNIIVDD